MHLTLIYNRVMSWCQIPPQHLKKLVNRVLLDTATIFPVMISIAIADSLYGVATHHQSLSDNIGPIKSVEFIFVDVLWSVMACKNYLKAYNLRRFPKPIQITRAYSGADKQTPPTESSKVLHYLHVFVEF